MPLRYSQETKFVTAVDVIRRVLARCECPRDAPKRYAQETGG